MKKWIAWICAASVIALVGCGPTYDLSTPEGRAEAFWDCTTYAYFVGVEDHLKVPDSYEPTGREVYWENEQGSLVPLGVLVLGEKSRDLLLAEDSYPKRVTVEFRAQNAFGVSIPGTAVFLVDAVDAGDCYRGVLLLSIE